MKTRMVAGFLGAGLLLAPLIVAQEHPQEDRQHTREAQKKADEHARKSPQMDDDMRRAIEFEHYKDQAAARQARIEARGEADRSKTNDHTGRDKDSRVKK